MTEDMEDRVRGALWGAFMGDALAMPSHWYYGGFGQVQADYGGPITTYIKPKTELQGSIMNLSNTGGAGRGSCDGDIIGSVINHGKKKYWERGRSCHYHCTLEAGENTLEAQLLLVLLQSINANEGEFHQDDFRQRYVHFMTTPGTHNDAYASTCHRMFFANLKIRGKDPALCPDNDQHNVDTIDGLVLPIGVALSTLNKPDEEAVATVSDCIAVTRRSDTLKTYGRGLTQALRSIINGDSMPCAMQNTAKVLRMPSAPQPAARDPVTA